MTLRNTSLPLSNFCTEALQLGMRCLVGRHFKHAYTLRTKQIRRTINLRDRRNARYMRSVQNNLF